MSQSQRNQVIREFEKAKIQVLVASDIAARGLDVEGVTHVFNYDIPRNLEYYVHRIGRTGRAGTSGIAITYATPEDGLLLRKLEKSISETITRYDEKGNVRRVRQGKSGMSNEAADSPRDSQCCHPQRLQPEFFIFKHTITSMVLLYH